MAVPTLTGVLDASLVGASANRRRRCSHLLSPPPAAVTRSRRVHAAAGDGFASRALIDCVAGFAHLIRRDSDRPAGHPQEAVGGSSLAGEAACFISAPMAPVREDDPTNLVNQIGRIDPIGSICSDVLLACFESTQASRCGLGAKLHEHVLLACFEYF